MHRLLVFCLIKSGVECVEILTVEAVLHQSEALAETLEVDDFAFA